MAQTQCLCQIFVQPQFARDHPANLRHFNAVRQSGTIMIAVWGNKNLCLGSQPAKRDRMHDPIPVTLKFAARPAHAFEGREADVPQLRAARAGVAQAVRLVSIGVEFGQKPGGTSV